MQREQGICSFQPNSTKKESKKLEETNPISPSKMEFMKGVLSSEKKLQMESDYDLGSYTSNTTEKEDFRPVDLMTQFLNNDVDPLIPNPESPKRDPAEESKATKDSKEKYPILFVDVNLGEDKSERLTVFEGESAFQVSSDFAELHGKCH